VRVGGATTSIRKQHGYRRFVVGKYSSISTTATTISTRTMMIPIHTGTQGGSQSDDPTEDRRRQLNRIVTKCFLRLQLRLITERNTIAIPAASKTSISFYHPSKRVKQLHQLIVLRFGGVSVNNDP
jgi:hypothetical protein